MEREWIPVGASAVFTIGAVVLSYFTKRKIPKQRVRIPKAVHMTLVIAPWAFGGVIAVNGAADSSVRAYKPTVVLKIFPRTYGRGGRGPELGVASWLPSGGILTVSVSDSCFKRLERGDSVTIVERQGALGFRWIQGVHECGR